MRVKICGLKTTEAAQAAIDGGADFLGFIFVKSSRRYIEPSAAANICRSLRGRSDIKTVGVFANEDADIVRQTVDECDLDYIQLHGGESAAYAQKMNRLVIKAFGWQDDFSAQRVNAYPSEFALIDTMANGQTGGTGQAFDWEKAATECAKVKKKLIIAGGISKDNAGDAARIFHPYALDVSGSLEEHGEKSPAKIKSFLEVVKQI